MVFADAKDVLAGVLFIMFFAGVVLFHLYIIVKHPEFYRGWQRQKHEREMAKQEHRHQRNQMIAGRVVGGLFSAFFRNR